MVAAAASFPEWLRGRSDSDLAKLLRRRPDLALPAPVDMAALAGRLSVRSSVQRALDTLDAFSLAVLAALDSAADEHADAGALERLRRDEDAFARALADLREIALVWDDGPVWHIVAAASELIEARRPAMASSTPPPITTTDHPPAQLDRSGATAVLETLRLTAALAAAWTAHPPVQLRSGGVGVRDLRRTARELNVPESTAALLAETALTAGLINATPEYESVYLPTPEFDAWTQRPPAPRWTTLALAWLAMTRQPSAVGARGERDRVIAVLGPDAERAALPALRRKLLATLASLPPGAAPRDRDVVLGRLGWQAPRRAGVELPLVAALLAEADLLGITAGGGLPGYSRTLLDGSRVVAEQVLTDALPEEVEEFVVQPDLTLVVPGPPTPELAHDLALLADLESSGGASVYRLSAATVRRALDAGRSAADLRSMLTQRSRTPIPQALQYLLDDAQRRHGTLRSGAAAAYLRSEDKALLARVAADREVAGLELRLLAPTVAVSPVPVGIVLQVLRAAGYAPAAEAPDGEIVAIDMAPRRAPSRPPARPVRVRSGAPEGTELMALVRRIRAGDTIGAGPARTAPPHAAVPGVTSAAIMGTLRTAIRGERLVLLGCAESDGSLSRHTLLPISMGGGFVRGHEPDSEQLKSYPLHRLTAVALLEDPAGDPP